MFTKFTGEQCPLTDDQIKYMVNRFLSWRLPENFSPDAGISFKPNFNEHTAHPMKHDPTGTNLFDAQQTEEMIRYLIDGMHSTLSDAAGVCPKCKLLMIDGAGCHIKAENPLPFSPDECEAQAADEPCPDCGSNRHRSCQASAPTEAGTRPTAREFFKNNPQFRGKGCAPYTEEEMQVIEENSGFLNGVNVWEFAEAYASQASAGALTDEQRKDLADYRKGEQLANELFEEEFTCGNGVKHKSNRNACLYCRAEKAEASAGPLVQKAVEEIAVKLAAIGVSFHFNHNTMTCAVEREETAAQPLVEALRLAFIPLAVLVTSGECTTAASALTEELKRTIIIGHNAAEAALRDAKKMKS